MVVALCAGCSGAGTVAPARSLDEFAVRLEQLRLDLKIPGMAATIVRDGQIVWARGFGLADQDANVPATPTTSFHAASLTKAVAATVIMRLVEQGAMTFDDPVANYGITFSGSAPVRVRHLLTMTSEGTPGETFRYNGDRFALLDRVVLSAAHRSFAELLMDWVIRPLALTQTAPNPGTPTAFNVTGFTRETFLANLAKPYAVQSGRIVSSSYPTSFSTAAGLVSSASDLARFVIALEAGSLIRDASRATMWSPAVTTRGDSLPYAVGWFSQRLRGVRVVWDYGYWTANSSLLVVVPDRRLAFVILANSDRLSAPFSLGGGTLLNSPVGREFLEAFVFGSAPLP
jgi:CubicO group peptidase (beta-lactamase class C family)